MVDWHKNYMAFMNPTSPSVMDPMGGDLIIKPSGYAADKVTVSQKLIQYIGAMSNCNVDIQHFVMAGTSCQYRLRCSKCGSTQPVEFNELSKELPDIMLSLGPFCNNHRHGPALTYAPATGEIVETTTTVVIGGRKYRDE